MNVVGSVALVTGSNRGIGAAIVDALLSAAVRKVYAGVRVLPDHAPADARVVPVQMDITDDARLEEVARELRDVSVLVNTAGVSSGHVERGFAQRAR